jgi:AraC-like DNA-binding protein
MSPELCGAAGARLPEGGGKRGIGVLTPVLLALDPAALSTFGVIHVLDPSELGNAFSRASGPPFNDSGVWHYQLQDRGLMRASFDDPITSIAERRLLNMMITHGGDRFATQIDIGGDGIDSYCFTAMFRGQATLIQHGRETQAAGTNGLVFRATPGTRILASNLNARESLWIEASALEHALEGMLGSRLRERLVFKPGIDWTSGLAASLRGQIGFMMREMARQGGVADNPIAAASLTDLVLLLVLRGIPHNYLERLERGRSAAVPGYVRRAEDFMRANATAPIRMEQIATAAGCSLRTLGAVFRQFRDTTPLAALHAIRLEQVHAELGNSVRGASIGEISRRYGFTNRGRFAAAYRHRFGEAAAETVRRH